MLDKMLMIMNRPNKQPGVKNTVSTNKNKDQQSGGPGFPLKQASNQRSSTTKGGRRRRKVSNVRLSDIENTHNRIIEEEVGNVYSGGSQNNHG